MASIGAPGSRPQFPTVSPVPYTEKLNMVLTTEEKPTMGTLPFLKSIQMKDMDEAEKPCIDN